MASQPPLRLFVAAYPPESTAEALRDLATRCAPQGARVIPACQIHMTLMFLGNVKRIELERVSESVASAARGMSEFELTPLGIRTLPEHAPPRLAALVTDAPPPLLEMRSRLVRRLASSSRRRPNDRFVPHFTLCRFAAHARVLEDEPDMNCISPFAITSLRLMRSVLTNQGASHSVMLDVPLHER